MKEEDVGDREDKGLESQWLKQWVTRIIVIGNRDNKYFKCINDKLVSF